MAFGVNKVTGRPGPAPKPPRAGDKVQARQRINVEVRTGRRPHPDTIPCADCGHIGGDMRHEYDHYLGYATEHHYDVQAVCVDCHVKRDSGKARQTHCISGHEFTPENTIIKSNGCRQCRECRREYDRRRDRGPDYWRTYRLKRKAQ